MTSKEISDVLYDNGIKPVNLLIADREYSVPTKKWFLDTFSSSLISNLIKIGIYRYTPEKNDCDDYARFAASLAQIFNFRSNPENKGLTVGEVWYMKDALGGHAINIAIVSNGKILEIVFMEPQTGRREFLSKKELESICYVRF